uniref:peptidylprolyl isomerase n=1 Tax=Globisporangium ultimum (strain ATCC 200006 / CBS 805.95 / DAOM BR144) TaxID=431595 RepID=K3WV23_GLOUD
MGVTKEILAAGDGPAPTKGATVTVHCTGYGKDNDLQQKFWSTKDPGQEPFAFRVGLGQVIKGWDEGVLGMKLGEKARLTCSPDYAYGAGGFPAWGYPFFFYCPNSTLIFEIEVLKIE